MTKYSYFPFLGFHYFIIRDLTHKPLHFWRYLLQCGLVPCYITDTKQQQIVFQKGRKIILPVTKIFLFGRPQIWHWYLFRYAMTRGLTDSLYARRCMPVDRRMMVELVVGCGWVGISDKWRNRLLGWVIRQGQREWWLVKTGPALAATNRSGV